ncbi:MAG: queuine tRNA-ribosyltransferase [Candidatus Peribacteria bacterium]|nr:queuine tRNA-ribosyltransferase [Candidatus Peribacteria bacterium]
MFDLLSESPLGRRGRLTTPHGVIESPFFMPVGTGGAMKGLSHHEIVELGAQILLCNTYHLHLRPGETIVQEIGGLHEYIGWNKPILTDSGGYQVFSLRGISKIDETGVKFQSHIDGSPLFIGPEESMKIQHALGSDIIMCFDHCPPSTAARADILAAVDRTLRWAAICKKTHDELNARNGTASLLFGIVQGGLEADLRKKCAEELIAIGFDGYAVGGLAVGETEAEMYDVLDYVLPSLPKDKPRYLMGVGKINQLLESVKKGIDMFDCVLPMREARHGNLILSADETIKISAGRYLHDHSVIDEHSPSPLSRLHRKSYLSYLLRTGERYGETIACMQNLGLTLQALDDLRGQMDS